MLRFAFSLAFAWLGLCIAPLTAAVVFEDNFESYANTAAFQAVWGAVGVGTLDNAAGNPGQSAAHAGGTDNTVGFTAFSPTATEHLRLTGQIFDDGTPGKRMSIGLRNDNSSNIIEMGFYNAPVHFASRVVLFQSGNPAAPGWVAFANNAAPPVVFSAPVVGWHTFSVEISNNTVDFSLDIGSDGTIDSTQSYGAVAFGAGFNQLRIGGPSGVSSAGPAKFDNLRLETIAVPEPTSAGVCALLGGLFMIRRRRR